MSWRGLTSSADIEIWFNELSLLYERAIVLPNGAELTVSSRIAGHPETGLPREQNRQLPRRAHNMTARDNSSRGAQWITSMEYKDMEPFFVHGKSNEP
jgi:hypothetical protein